MEEKMETIYALIRSYKVGLESYLKGLER